MERIMWEAAEVVFAVINTAIIFLFVQSFFGKKKNMRTIVTIAAILAVLSARVFAAFVFTDNAVVTASISISSVFFLGYVLFHNKILGASIAAFLSFLAGATSELFATFLVTSFQGVPFAEVMQFNLYRLLTRIVSILLMLIIILLVRRFRQGSLQCQQLNELKTRFRKIF